MTYTYAITSKCTGCTLCSRVCPEKCISGERKAQHIIDQARCSKCGKCYETCRFGAISRTSENGVVELCPLPQKAAPAAGKTYALKDSCTLCGVCVTTCSHITKAIETVAPASGTQKTATVQSQKCIGCLACVRTCPEDAIPFTVDGTRVEIWAHTFTRSTCPTCGKPTTTPEHASWLAPKARIKQSDLGICDRCKVERTANTYRKIRW